MNKKKTVFENDFNITEEQMDSLVRVLFPMVYDYLASEKGAENDIDNVSRDSGGVANYLKFASKAEKRLST